MVSPEVAELAAEERLEGMQQQAVRATSSHTEVSEQVLEPVLKQIVADNTCVGAVELANLRKAGVKQTQEKTMVFGSYRLVSKTNEQACAMEKWPTVVQKKQQNASTQLVLQVGSKLNGDEAFCAKSKLPKVVGDAVSEWEESALKAQSPTEPQIRHHPHRLRRLTLPQRRHRQIRNHNQS